MVNERRYHSGNEGLAELLGLVRYVTDMSESHLQVRDAGVCLKCEQKPCIARCCAEVYRWEGEQGELEIAYENCLECGACKIVCPFDNIDWNYPRGGYGLSYKYG